MACTRTPRSAARARTSEKIAACSPQYSYTSKVTECSAFSIASILAA